MEESRLVHNPTPIFAGVAAAAIFFALLRGPVGKAIGKMLEGSAVPDEQLTERIEQLEDRVAELSNDQRSVAELEERLDFAERLLAQRGDAVPSEAPGGPAVTRERSSEWIGAMFVGLGLGAAGVAGALAWVTSMIGPAAIPIWAFAAAGAIVRLSWTDGSGTGHANQRHCAS